MLTPLDDSYPPDALNEREVRAEAQEAGYKIPVAHSQRVRNQVRQAMPATKTKRAKTTKAVDKKKRRILARERQRKALELRKAGLTYQAIADQLGYTSVSGARQSVIRAFDEIIQEDTEELRRLQIERLNQMLVPVYAKAVNGDEGSMRTALAIMDKIDALKGTNAAQEITTKNINQGAVLIIDGDKDEYIAAMKRMAGLNPDGTNAGSTPIAQPVAAIEAPTHNYPPGMGPEPIIDAEVLADTLDAQDVQTIKAIMAPPEEESEEQEEKPTFDFSVPPTI